MESWLQITEFPDYEISDLGQIRNWRGNILAGHRAGWKLAYRYITLTKNRHSSSRSIGRLVLTTFAGPAPDGYECRHLNGVHHDDRLANLAWGTHSENLLDQRRHDTWWKTGRQKLVPDDITTIFGMRAEGMTQTRIAHRMGVQQPQISRILSGESWRYL